MSTKPSKPAPAKPKATTPALPKKRRAELAGEVTKAKPFNYVLRLYVAGKTPKSMAALENIKVICEEHLAGRYKLQVVDLLENPQLARGDQILAIPTLVRKLPLPMRRIIGDLSNTERVLIGLDLVPRK